MANNDMDMRKTPQLVELLQEMKNGLDTVRKEVQSLCLKVKENQLPTADGISYLEAKHLLLLGYCSTIVHYLLRKAKGFSIEGHPVVRSLVEIRLFLEKIRPLDKKLEYQIKKLIGDASKAAEQEGAEQNQSNATQETKDLLRYRPAPEKLVSRTNKAPEDNGVNKPYEPPRIAPTTMEDDRMSKQEKLDKRREREIVFQSNRSPYVRELMNDFEGKPEEVREAFGNESWEVTKHMEKMEKRARIEEDLFTRAPLTKMEKKKEKHLKKSRNGLQGMTDGFFDEIRTLPLGDDGSHGDDMTNFSSGGRGGKKFNKRKRKH